jgi:ABC-type multidrug transport system fused ATPase/permease subunit
MKRHISTNLELKPRSSITSFAISATQFARLSTIRDADKVIVIKDVEIVERGTHQQLLEAKGFFHHLYMSQNKGLAI